MTVNLYRDLQRLDPGTLPLVSSGDGDGWYVDKAFRGRPAGLSPAGHLFREAQLLRRPDKTMGLRLVRVRTFDLVNKAQQLGTDELWNGLKEYTASLPMSKEQASTGNTGLDMRSVLTAVSPVLVEGFCLIGGGALSARRIPVATRDCDVIVPGLAKVLPGLRDMAQRSGAIEFVDDDPTVSGRNIDKFCCTFPDGSILEVYDLPSVKRAYWPIRSLFHEFSKVDVGGFEVDALSASAAMQCTLYVDRHKDRIARPFLTAAVSAVEGRSIFDGATHLEFQRAPLYGNWVGS